MEYKLFEIQFSDAEREEVAKSKRPDNYGAKYNLANTVYLFAPSEYEAQRIFDELHPNCYGHWKIRELNEPTMIIAEFTNYLLRNEVNVQEYNKHWENKLRLEVQKEEEIYNNKIENEVRKLFEDELIPDYLEIDMDDIDNQVRMYRREDNAYPYYLKDHFGLLTDAEIMEHYRHDDPHENYSLYQELIENDKVRSLEDFGIEPKNITGEYVEVHYMDDIKVLWVTSEWGASAWYIGDTIDKCTEICCLGGGKAWKMSKWYIDRWIATGKTQNDEGDLK